MSRKIGAGLVLQASRLDYEFALLAGDQGCIKLPGIPHWAKGDHPLFRPWQWSESEGSEAQGWAHLGLSHHAVRVSVVQVQALFLNSNHL